MLYILTACTDYVRSCIRTTQYQHARTLTPNRTPNTINTQTYELRRLMSQKSLRDVDIVPEHGPNCYANLTAAVNGEKQGG